jgi:hypothetical protein
LEDLHMEVLASVHFAKVSHLNRVPVYYLHLLQPVITRRGKSKESFRLPLTINEKREISPLLESIVRSGQYHVAFFFLFCNLNEELKESGISKMRMIRSIE